MGKCFYITVNELEKAHKVMYHCWKNHVWCFTWCYNIMKQTCMYTLCYSWHHSLMELNCEMSKTHNKYTYHIFRHYQWWWGKILCLEDSQIPSHLKLGWKDVIKSALYRHIVSCVCCTLTIKYPIFIDLSFNHSYGGDDNFIPQYEPPTTLSTTLIMGSKCWLLRQNISHPVQVDLGTVYRISIPSPSAVVLWSPLWTGTRVTSTLPLYNNSCPNTNTLMDSKVITEKGHTVWVKVTLIKCAGYESQWLATYRS